MIYNLYTVRDEASQRYMTPVAAENDSVAIRQFSIALHNDATMRAYARDFALYQIGTWDDVKAEVAPLPATLVYRPDPANLEAQK